MHFFDIAALVLGAGLIFSGIRAIRRREARVPQKYEGRSAVRLGWLWIALGGSFIAAVVFDVPLLKAFFRLFLEAPN